MEIRELTDIGFEIIVLKKLGVLQETQINYLTKSGTQYKKKNGKFNREKTQERTKDYKMQEHFMADSVRQKKEPDAFGRCLNKQEILNIMHRQGNQNHNEIPPHICT